MHIHGQGFYRVSMKTDGDSRIRFADLQGQLFNGGSQKETAENYNCKPSFQILCACSPSLPCMTRGCSSSLILSVRLAAMVTRCMRVAGIIVVLVCWSSFPISCDADWNRKWNSPTRDISCVLANTTYKLYMFFKYYGREKIRVEHLIFSTQTAVPTLGRRWWFLFVQPPYL